jgi:hypothetical protein
VLQGEKLKLASPWAPLLDSFHEDDLQALAHPPSHSTVSGVLSIDGAMEVTGDRDWCNVEERENKR